MSSRPVQTPHRTCVIFRQDGRTGVVAIAAMNWQWLSVFTPPALEAEAAGKPRPLNICTSQAIHLQVAALRQHGHAPVPHAAPHPPTQWFVRPQRSRLPWPGGHGPAPAHRRGQEHQRQPLGRPLPPPERPGGAGGAPRPRACGRRWAATHERQVGNIDSKPPQRSRCASVTT